MADNKIDNGPLSSAGAFGERLLDNIASQGAGIISTKQTAKFASGARVTLRLNGKLVGFCFGVSWRINTIQQEINTIDDYLPHEIAPQRITVEGTLSGFHIPGSGPTAEFLQANLGSFLFHKYIEIEVRDSATDALLFYTSRAAITSRIEEIRTEQLGTMQLSFKSVGWYDERKPGLPSDANTVSKDTQPNTNNINLAQRITNTA